MSSAQGFLRDCPGPLNLLPGQRPPHMGRREAEFSKCMNEETEEIIKKNPDCDIFLRVTTANVYRRKTDDHLYVPRAPHQVRPFSHAGIQYNLDGSKGIPLSLHNPLKTSEYQQNSVRFHTAHRLCLPCRDMLNYYCEYRETRSQRDREKVNEQAQGVKSIFPLSNAVVQHFNLFSLEASVSIDECYICSYLMRSIRNGFDTSTSQFEDFQIECCWKQSLRKGQNDDIIYFVMYKPAMKKEQVWNYRHLFQLQLWPEEVFGHHFVMNLVSGSIDTAMLENLTFDDYDRDDKPVTIALARSWHTKCKSNRDGKHQECNRCDNEYLPTRLLDVKHAIKTSQLRLVYPKSRPFLFSNARYATLSHCWGIWGASENPVLTIDNLQRRLAVGLQYSDVPQTFQDAVTVANWLQIDWLWIDCLCIIQDSKDDWIHEARLMDRTYQNAEINISSDFGEDSRSGLFVDRDYLSITSFQMEAPKLGKTWHITPKTTFDWMSHAESFSRAWIHRERQLARRILHFTGKELVWECCGTGRTSFASESLPGGAPFEDLFNEDTKFQSGRLHESLGLEADETYGVWNDLCERLSDKYVTVPTDMPIILSSLAQEVHRMLPSDQYLAGLWKSTLPHGLTWRTKSYGANKRKVYAPADGDRIYIAPSWSWLSVGVPVTLALETPSMHLVPVATVMDTQLELGYDDSYGPVKHGALVLEGFLRSIQVDFDDNGRTFQLSVCEERLHEGEADTITIKLRHIGSSWHEYNGNMCNLELDQRPKTLTLKCYCLLTTIEEWAQDQESNHRNVTCLLLETVEEANNTYKRIGMLSLEDLYSLKMRYVLDYGWEDDDTSDEGSEASEEAENGSLSDTKQSGEQHSTAVNLLQLKVAGGTENQVKYDPDVPVLPSVRQGSSVCEDMTAELRDSCGPSFDEMNSNELQEPTPEKVGSSGKKQGNTNNQSETTNAAGTDAEEQSQADTEEDDDHWNILLKFLKIKRWPIIEAAKKRQRAEEDKENWVKEETDLNASTSNDGGLPLTADISRKKGEAGEGHQSVAGSTERLQHDFANTSEEPSIPTSEVDIVNKTNGSDEDAKTQTRIEAYGIESEDDARHDKSPEGEQSSGDESDKPKFDYGMFRSTTPAWGQQLPPLEALYQFDDVLDDMQKEDGAFLWLRKLQTTKVTII